MEYLKVFTDFEKTMEPLGDAERGRLFAAMLRYAADGTEPDFSGNERFIWPTAKLHIDRTAAEYGTIAKKNRENGKKGGRPRKTESPKNPPVFLENPKNPPVFLETQKSQDKDKDKDKDKDIIPPNIPPKGKPSAKEQRFERFWSAYPRKVGKGNARKAFDRINPDEALLEAILSAISVQKQCPQWTKDGGQFIPHPATWLNQQRWEDEVDAPQKRSGGYFEGEDELAKLFGGG